jgi:glucose-1-phosphate cytidylyltransferase
MKISAHYGFQHFIVCLGYRGNMIKEYFLNYEAMNNDFTICLGRKNTIIYHEEHREQDFYVTLAEKGAGRMTGGRVKRIEKYIDRDNFMVTYGDGVGDVNIDALIDFHNSHGKLATVTAFRPISRLGILEVDSDSRVVEFSEKPQIDGWISVRYMIFNRLVFEYFGGDDYILAQEQMQRLAAEKQLMAYRPEGCFFARDSYREYNYLNELWEEGRLLGKCGNELVWGRDFMPTPHKFE